MLDIKGDIEKKKEQEQLEKIDKPEEEKKQTADEKLKEDYDKVKTVVSKVTAPAKAVWHFVPDSAKSVLALSLGGGLAGLSALGNKKAGK